MADRGLESRKQPYVVPGKQQWASNLVVAQHSEALWMFGENCLFTMMWRAIDFENGLVGRCTTCYVGNRGAEAFGQPPSKKGCPNCYGTTFEGGIRAQIIRPTIFSDRNSETSDLGQGTVVSDSLQVETTADFVFTKGDYIFRGDGSRYQAEEKGEGVVRTGFGIPASADSFRGTIPVARLEDPTSLGYRLPPSTPDVMDLLSGAPNAMDLSGEGLPSGTGREEIFPFISQTVWECSHTLGERYPDVTLVDEAGNQIVGEIDFVSPSLLRVTWFRPTSGRAVLRV